MQLAAITSVFTRVHEELLAAEPVGQLLQGFLDVSRRCSLERAAELGSERLFRRVLVRDDEATRRQQQQQPDDDPETTTIVRRHRLTRALEVALRRGHAPIVAALDDGERPLRFHPQLLLAAAQGGQIASMARVLGLAAREADPPFDLFGHWPDVVECAAECGHFGVIRWLWAQGELSFEHVVSVGYHAAVHGDLETLRWLDGLDVGGSAVASASIPAAVASGRLEIVRFVHAHSATAKDDGVLARALSAAILDGTTRPESAAIIAYLEDVAGARPDWAFVLAHAGRRGRADLLQGPMPASIADHYGRPWYTGTTLRKTQLDACGAGHLEVVRLITEGYGLTCSNQALAAAAQGGHLGILEWAHAHDCGIWSPGILDAAADGGQLAIVQWLHEHRPEGGTKRAMNAAAAGGHLEVVQWLHGHRPEGCTVGAMDSAARNGHLAVVAFLHAHREEGCTTKAMDHAAANGHLEVVAFLHEHRHEGGTSRAMDRAARMGHLEVVRWLHAHRSEGCTATAIEQCGDDDVLEWLAVNRPEDAGAEMLTSPEAVGHAARDGNLRRLRWLLTRDPQLTVGMELMDILASDGLVRVLQWLHEHVPHVVVPVEHLLTLFPGTHRHVQAWLATLATPPSSGDNSAADSSPPASFRTI